MCWPVPDIECITCRPRVYAREHFSIFGLFVFIPYRQSSRESLIDNFVCNSIEDINEDIDFCLEIHPIAWIPTRRPDIIVFKAEMYINAISWKGRSGYKMSNICSVSTIRRNSHGMRQDNPPCTKWAYYRFHGQNRTWDLYIANKNNRWLYSL